MQLHLYADPRSSSSLRVLCYLRFKQVEALLIHVGLMKDEHLLPSYVANNPSASLPALDIGEGAGTPWLTQTQAIIEWLEATYPQPAGLPIDELSRARVRSLCALVACDIHPITNMRVRRALLAATDADTAAAWNRDWTARGMASIEAWLTPQAGLYCHGDTVTMADFFVAPAVLNALRFKCDMAPYPLLQGIYRRCLEHPAFEPMRAAAT